MSISYSLKWCNMVLLVTLVFTVISSQAVPIATSNYPSCLGWGGSPTVTVSADTDVADCSIVDQSIFFDSTEDLMTISMTNISSVSSNIWLRHSGTTVFNFRFQFGFVHRIDLSVDISFVVIDAHLRAGSSIIIEGTVFETTDTTIARIQGESILASTSLFVIDNNITSFSGGDLSIVRAESDSGLTEGSTVKVSNNRIIVVGNETQVASNYFKLYLVNLRSSTTLHDSTIIAADNNFDIDTGGQDLSLVNSITLVSFSSTLDNATIQVSKNLINWQLRCKVESVEMYFISGVSHFYGHFLVSGNHVLIDAMHGGDLKYHVARGVRMNVYPAPASVELKGSLTIISNAFTTANRQLNSSGVKVAMLYGYRVILDTNSKIAVHDNLISKFNDTLELDGQPSHILLVELSGQAVGHGLEQLEGSHVSIRNNTIYQHTSIIAIREEASITKTITVLGFKTISLTLHTGAVLEYSNNTIDVDIVWGGLDGVVLYNPASYNFIDPYQRQISMDIGWFKGTGGINIQSGANLTISRNRQNVKTFLVKIANVYLMYVGVSMRIEHQSILSITHNEISAQHQRSPTTNTRILDLYNGDLTVTNSSIFTLSKNRLVVDGNLTHEAVMYAMLVNALVNVSDSQFRVEGNEVVHNSEFPKYIESIFAQFQQNISMRSGVLHFEGNNISLIGVVPEVGGVSAYLEFLDQADSGITASLVGMVHFKTLSLTFETTSPSIPQVASSITVANSTLTVWIPSLPLPALFTGVLHLNEGTIKTGSGSTCTLNVLNNVVEVHIASFCRINTTTSVALATLEEVSVAGTFNIEGNYLNHTISDDPNIVRDPCMIDQSLLEYKAISIRTWGTDVLRVLINRNEMWGTYAPRPFDKVRVQLISTVFEKGTFAQHTYLTATHNIVNISHGADTHQNASTLVKDITGGNAFIFVSVTPVSVESKTDVATYCTFTSNTITVPITQFNWGSSISAFILLYVNGAFTLPLGVLARLAGNRFTAVVGGPASIPSGATRSNMVALRLQAVVSGSGGIQTLLESTGNTFEVEYFESAAPSEFLSFKDRTTAFQAFYIFANFRGKSSLKLCKNTMIATNRMTDPPQIGTRQIISNTDATQAAVFNAVINLTNCLPGTPTPTMSLLITRTNTTTLPVVPTPTATPIMTRSPTPPVPHSPTRTSSSPIPNNTATDTQQHEANTTATPSTYISPSLPTTTVNNTQNMTTSENTTTQQPLNSTTTTTAPANTTTESTTTATTTTTTTTPPLTCGALIATKNGKPSAECNGTVSLHALWTTSYDGQAVSSSPFNVTTSPPYIADSQAAAFRSRVQSTTLEVCQALASPVLLGEDVGWNYWASDSNKAAWVVLGGDDGPFNSEYHGISNTSDLVALNSHLQFTASHLHVDGTTEGTAPAGDFYVKLEAPLQQQDDGSGITTTSPPPYSVRHMRLVVTYNGDVKLNGFSVRVSIPTSRVLRCAGPSQLVVQMHLAPQKQLTDPAVIGEAVGGTVTIAAGISGSPGSVVKGGMLASLSALLRCESPDLSAEVPLLQNTLGIRFGAEQGQYQRGGIISGVIILAIVTVALAAALIPSKMFALRQEYASHGGGASARRKHGAEPSWADAVRFAHFPGVLILAVAISGEAIVPSAATLVSMPNATGGDIVFGVVCLVAFFAYVAHVLITVFRPPIVVRTVAKLKRAQQQSRPAALFVYWFNSPAVIVPIGLDGAEWLTPTPGLVSQLRSIVGQRKLMESAASKKISNNVNNGINSVDDGDVNRKKKDHSDNSSIAIGITWFLRFAPYADEITLIPFKALELLAGSIVNLLDGVVTEHCFIKAIVLMVVITLLFVLIIVKRPYAVPVQQVTSISLFGSMLLATIVVTVNLFKQHPTLDQAAEVLFVLASAFTVLQAVIDVTVSLVTVHVLLTAVWEWRRRAAAAAARGDDDDMAPIPTTLHQPMLQQKEEGTTMPDRAVHATPSPSAAASSPTHSLSRTHDVLISPSTSATSSSDDILPPPHHPRRHTEMDMDFPEDEREVQRRLLAEMETWEEEHPLL